jgi:REP element-mobilizing transposase RayT
MPRMPRRDAPGAIHHVTIRGVGGCDIFVDDVDRAFLWDRIGIVSAETGASILAAAFMSNHVHIVIRTGLYPLSHVMARINTAYAMHFNRRHGRPGHLFQNRYGAELIEDDGYLRNTIRYVHVNPLAAGIVADLPALERYRWVGHGALLGLVPAGFFDVRAALAVFGESIPAARSALREFMKEWAGPDARSREARPRGIEDAELEAEIERRSRELGVDPSELTGGSRRRAVCRVREIVGRSALASGRRASELALRLGVTHASLLRAVKRPQRDG